MKNKIIKRSFMPGSEWLYYKIYSGPKTSDYILSYVIYPVLKNLLNTNIITKWFFIRYLDPDYHLRIRLLLADDRNYNLVLKKISNKLEIYLRKNIIWKIQLDMYNREIERYGNNMYEYTESLFFYDSIMTTKMIRLIEGDEGEEFRWKFALKATDDLLDRFGLDLQKKILFIENYYNSFSAEFGMNKLLKKQISNNFRNHTSIITEFFNNSKNNYPLIKLINEKNCSTKGIIDIIIINTSSDKEFNDLLFSYLHMMINRIFRTNQRLHELIISAYLLKFYKSLNARIIKEMQIN